MESQVKEPDPAPTETSSTKESIYQNACTAAYIKADAAVKSMLAVYESMSEAEQRAFDIGEAYHSMLDLLDELGAAFNKETRYGHKN